MNRTLLRRIGQVGTVAVAVLTLYFTLSPSPPEPPGGLPSWAGHFVMFALLGAMVALWYATSEAAQQSPRRMLLMILLGIWIFAAATELAQGLIAGRDANIQDWFANITGGLTGLFAGSALWRLLLERRLY